MEYTSDNIDINAAEINLSERNCFHENKHVK